MKKSRMLLRLFAALMAIVLMMMSGVPALAASIKAKINSSSAKIYNVPSTSSKVYVQGGKGVTVDVTAYANGWARISYKGKTGYTQAKNLDLASRITGYTKKSTPVYLENSASSSCLGTLPVGSTVYVVGASGDFYRVQNASGSVTGYVQKGTLATKAEMMAAYELYLAYLEANQNKPSGGDTPSVTPPSSGNPSIGDLSAADKIIAEALKHLGKGYALSANPPSTFNCSAYVKYVYEKFGYDMKSTAKEQCADSRYTLITDISKLKKGDILCFDTTESDDAKDGKMVCDHTAIYYGDGTFLESSRSAGKVQVNTLSSWYKDRFMCARRVL